MYAQKDFLDYYEYNVDYEDLLAGGKSLERDYDDFVGTSLWPAVSENRFHFNSKEDQSLFGTPYIDYGARQYDPAIARWNAVDPLAEKYYPVTPYAFCTDNPVNLVDPDGMDIWELDSLGHIVAVIRNNEYDAFHIVKQNSYGNWERTGQSISFDYGTIGKVYSDLERESTVGGKINLTMFEVRGDDNAQNLFEFMANPEFMGVEWEHIKIGAADSGRNVVGNSHVKDKTGLLRYYFNTGYTIRESNHSHPSGRSQASPNDKAAAKIVQEFQSECTFYVYIHPYIYTRFGK